ncbi:hypothetical protein AZ021_004036, partial [Enterobacter ludwigii]
MALEFLFLFTGCEYIKHPVQALFQSLSPAVVSSAAAPRQRRHCASRFAAQSPILCVHQEVGAHLCDFRAPEYWLHPRAHYPAQRRHFVTSADAQYAEWRILR